MPWLLDKTHGKKMILVPVMIEKALVEHAYYKFPDPQTGPNEIKLSDLQIEMYEGRAVSGLEKPEQNVFIDRLAQTILARIDG